MKVGCFEIFVKARGVTLPELVVDGRTIIIGDIGSEYVIWVHIHKEYEQYPCNHMFLSLLIDGRDVNNRKRIDLSSQDNRSAGKDFIMESFKGFNSDRSRMSFVMGSPQKSTDDRTRTHSAKELQAKLGTITIVAEEAEVVSTRPRYGRETCLRPYLPNGHSIHEDTKLFDSPSLCTIVGSVHTKPTQYNSAVPDSIHYEWESVGEIMRTTMHYHSADHVAVLKKMEKALYDEKLIKMQSKVEPAWPTNSLGPPVLVDLCNDDGDDDDNDDTVVKPRVTVELIDSSDDEGDQGDNGDDVVGGSQARGDAIGQRDTQGLSGDTAGRNLIHGLNSSRTSHNHRTSVANNHGTVQYRDMSSSGGGNGELRSSSVTVAVGRNKRPRHHESSDGDRIIDDFHRHSPPAPAAADKRRTFATTAAPVATTNCNVITNRSPLDQLHPDGTEVEDDDGMVIGTETSWRVDRHPTPQLNLVSAQEEQK